MINMEKQREDFEKELLKLRYTPVTELDDPQKRSSDFAPSDFARKFGAYTIIVTVRHPEYGDRWITKGILQLGPNETVRIGPEIGARSFDYDITEFEQAQCKLVKYLTEVFIPNAEKAIKLPNEELSDLLKEKT